MMSSTIDKTDCRYNRPLFYKPGDIIYNNVILSVILKQLNGINSLLVNMYVLSHKDRFLGWVQGIPSLETAIQGKIRPTIMESFRLWDVGPDGGAIFFHQRQMGRLCCR